MEVKHEILMKHNDLVKLTLTPSIYIKETLELESLYSSEVEGYFTTKGELSKFIQGEKNPATKDEKAVYSNYLALKYGLENKENQCSKDFILKLNSIILDENYAINENLNSK